MKKHLVFVQTVMLWLPIPEEADKRFASVTTLEIEMYAYLTCLYFLKKIAKELSEFAFPALEVVFRGLLLAREKEGWSCLARLVEFVQNHARNGWSKEDAQTFHEITL